MEVPVPSQESELSCICVLGVSILTHSTILIIDFGNVRTEVGLEWRQIWTAKQINSEISWNFNGYIIFSSLWTCINSPRCFVGIVLLNLGSVLWITFCPFVLFYFCHCIVCFSIYVCFRLTLCYLQTLHTFWIIML
jgi:hypothetical protein